MAEDTEDTETSTDSAAQVEQLVRRELVHTFAGLPLDDFMRLVDDSGGWPVGYTYVSFYHDGPIGDRYCKFTNKYLRTGLWTTICSSDEYHYWKLSNAKKAEILEDARKQIISQLR